MDDYLHIERHQEQRPQRGERQQGVHLQPVQERQPELRFMRVEERGRVLHLHVEGRQHCTVHFVLADVLLRVQCVQRIPLADK